MAEQLRIGTKWLIDGRHYLIAGCTSARWYFTAAAAPSASLGAAWTTLNPPPGEHTNLGDSK